ncbi:Putative membrane protein [Bordetella parapertussis Bpp5]|uniref:Membrane protein n=1 Tax=Bordetella parapertussis (strain Bpp5) TaxID=1208660 RepID=K0M9V2_BORPB|nr:Putative membrane protein [Bordetella parapertussis Bpp5]
MAQFFLCNRPAVIVPSIIVAGLLVAGLWGGTRAPGDDAHADVRMLQLDTAPLACLPPAAVQQIKQKLDDIEPAYQACRDELEKRTKGMGLDDKGLRVVFATLTAHASATYGNTTAYDRAALLKADDLTSVGYLLLLGHFMQALNVPSNSMRIIGFQGGDRQLRPRHDHCRPDQPAARSHYWHGRENQLRRSAQRPKIGCRSHSSLLYAHRSGPEKYADQCVERRIQWPVPPLRPSLFL